MIDLRIVSPECISRFWCKVDQSGGPTACWPWKEGHTKDGYGCFWGGKTLRSIRANRFALAITKGIREDALALHSCDNPSCCNPEHLRSGTPKQNSQEMAQRGRNRGGPVGTIRGEAINSAKVTEVIVRKIRQEYIPHKVGLALLGKKYGLAVASVYKIVTRKSWAHVD